MHADYEWLWSMRKHRRTHTPRHTHTFKHTVTVTVVTEAGAAAH